MRLRLSTAVLGVLAITLLAVSHYVQVSPTGSLPSHSFEGSFAPPLARDVVPNYGQIPMSFERNQGQADARVKFLARGHGYTLFLTGDEAILKFGDTSQVRHAPQASARQSRPDVLRMKLVDVAENAMAEGLEQLPGRSNYFVGNDPKKWRTGVANYAKVQYRDVYPGIDLVYYGKQSQFEYDFVVAPGADPDAIQLEVSHDASNQLQIDSTGTLVVDPARDVRFHKPVIYQTTNGKRQIVDGRYKLLAANRVGFEISNYDKTKALVIDPVVGYSSFLGGSGADAIDSVSIAIDSAGNAYVASGTMSTDFPVTAGSAQGGYAGGPPICDQGSNFCGDAFVTKINPTGTAIVYSTYLGGSNSDYAFGLAVDASGNAYVTGLTDSTNFPVTPGAFQPVFGGTTPICDEYVCGDTFVTKLNSTGSALIYSSYLGGSGNEHAEAIAVDAQGSAYVTGDTGSSNFPTTPGAFQTQFKGADVCQSRSGATIPCHNAFLSKVNASGTQLVYSTYLGGTGSDGGSALVVDGLGRATSAGGTCSADFPVTANAFQPANHGSCDVYLSTFNATGSKLLYSTFFGGSAYEGTFAAAIDSSQNIYLSGLTYSNDFPVTPGAYQTVAAGNGDAFVAKFNPRLSGAASLVYSTYIGGSQGDFGIGVAVDSAGNAYTAGQTTSTDFPLVSPVQAILNGKSDVFVAELNPQGSALVYSTYLGGSGAELSDYIASDPSGNVYVVGWTQSPDFPTTPRSFQPAYGGGTTDLFVTKISPINAAGVSFVPASLTFSPQAVGTASAAQNVVIHNLGSAMLTISSLIPTGDFAQANDCGGRVSAGGSCALTIRFQPTAVGPRSGNVSVTDNASGSPQQIPLTGTGK